METKLTNILKLKYKPVVLSWSDSIPEKTIQFAKGKFGCVLNLFAAAAKGKFAACDRETFGCFGGGVGLGFGNQYNNFPGGVDCFCRFLSVGNQGYPPGETVAGYMKGKAPAHFLSDFMKGERFIKTPELTKKFVEAMPMEDMPAKYALFSPLSSVSSDSEDTTGPKIVTFIADPDQLSGLVLLATYATENIEAVAMPFVAGCMAIGILPLRESKSENPRGIMGLIDLSARVNVKSSLGRGFFTLSVPWKMFITMESNIPGSFFERETWKHLMDEEQK
ncbi:MAG: DUF169 domain-containing protein [Candidatus Riflebacteria bacterium]|nr:DUF169 domain-containing protein [Candidatus Riflebacteria bacterium]